MFVFQSQHSASENGGGFAFVGEAPGVKFGNETAVALRSCSALRENQRRLSSRATTFM